MTQPITRDFTVAVFVRWHDHVLLHWHRKLSRWLPPGGHIEPHELPDDAAIREALEETGLPIRLVGDRGLPIDHPGQPRQLVMPKGIQLEDIAPGHQHIDLVYFAVPEAATESPPVVQHGATWVPRSELATLDLTDEIRDWLHRLFSEDHDAAGPSDRGTG